LPITVTVIRVPENQEKGLLEYLSDAWLNLCILHANMARHCGSVSDQVLRTVEARGVMHAYDICIGTEKDSVHLEIIRTAVSSTYLGVIQLKLAAEAAAAACHIGPGWQ
jgi:hypothetical protein